MIKESDLLNKETEFSTSFINYVMFLLKFASKFASSLMSSVFLAHWSKIFYLDISIDGFTIHKNSLFVRFLSEKNAFGIFLNV